VRECVSVCMCLCVCMCACICLCVCICVCALVFTCDYSCACMRDSHTEETLCDTNTHIHTQTCTHKKSHKQNTTPHQRRYSRPFTAKGNTDTDMDIPTQPHSPTYPATHPLNITNQSIVHSLFGLTLPLRVLGVHFAARVRHAVCRV